MFSTELPRLLEAAAAIGRGAPIDPARTRAILEKAAAGRTLETGEVVALLDGLSVAANRREVLAFSASFRRPSEREVFLLTPLYFSSVCENSCAYCDFGDRGGRLSVGEFQEELDELLSLGYRAIELVSSQDPLFYKKGSSFDIARQAFEASPATELFRITRDRLDGAGGGLLISNIPPLDLESFRELRAAGLDLYLSWVECFDTTQYARLHRCGTPKSNQAFRLDSFERALEAGIPGLAGAFLKGLADWRREEAVLYLFDRWLRDRRGSGFSIIGTPRLKGRFAGTPAVSGFAVGDEDYELNLALDRVLFDGTLWLQTRETSDFNIGFLKRYGGGVLLTADCSTAPGGYRRASGHRPQFPVHRQDLGDAVRKLEDAGFRPRFDWNGRTLRELQKGS